MKPIPVLIVDDEYLIRSLVRNSIDWPALGFDIVGEAEDGEEALRLVGELQPRLLVLDINIPFINGLDLSLRLRESYPNLRIVILTGYEDFHYARRAIRAGVVDYLLKPIDPEELEKAVIAAREAIIRHEDERTAAGADAERAREQRLRALLSGEAAPGAPAADAGEAPPVLCLFDIQPPLSAEELRAAVAGFPCELLPYRDGLIVLLAADDNRTSRVKDKAYYAACEEAVRTLGARGYSVSVGIAPPEADPAGLPRAYERASAALEEAFYQGDNRIFLFDPRAPQRRDDSQKLPPPPSRDAMLMKLRGGGAKELASTLQAAFRDTGRLRAPRQYCQAMYLDALFAVQEYLKDSGFAAGAVPGLDDDAYRSAKEMRTLAAMSAKTSEIVARAAATVENQGKTRTHLVVKKAQLFIERHYARKNVTLELIAEHAAVSPSYISTVFKKELGLSVIEYLTATRLEAAKRLMDADPLGTIIAVADRVGYSDPYYFSKCFRKHFGVAPTVYLRRKNPSVLD